MDAKKLTQSCTSIHKNAGFLPSLPANPTSKLIFENILIFVNGKDARLARLYFYGNYSLCLLIGEGAIRMFVMYESVT